MTRLAVGRHWREASPTQQQSLENAFRSLLVTTYTQALTQATTADQVVEVRPAPVKPADEDVTVKTFVKDSSRKPLAIDYRLSKANNSWKVYDVVVENLSLVTNYRSSFNSEITKFRHRWPDQGAGSEEQTKRRLMSGVLPGSPRGAAAPRCMGRPAGG